MPAHHNLQVRRMFLLTFMFFAALAALALPVGARPAQTGKADRWQRVEVRVPMTVVAALLSGGKDELDLVAALQALGDHPDTELVTVEDGENTVRVWLDSKNTAD